MSASVNNEVEKYKNYQFPSMRSILGNLEYDRLMIYSLMNEVKVFLVDNWEYFYLPNCPLNADEMKESLLVSYPTMGTINEPFTTAHMEVWRVLFHQMCLEIHPRKYNFYYGKFVASSEFEMLEDLLKFYSLTTGRHYEVFLPNTYFRVFRKRTHNCLRVQYATSLSEGDLMDYWILLPYSYDPKLYALIGFILMLRTFHYVMNPKDLVDYSIMFHEHVTESDYHISGEFQVLDPLDRKGLDVLDLAFFEKFAPSFYIPTRDSLLALCLHAIDSRTANCPYIKHHNCEDEDISLAYPDDEEESGVSLAKFLRGYDPITSIMDRVVVGFK